MALICWAALGSCLLLMCFPTSSLATDVPWPRCGGALEKETWEIFDGEVTKKWLIEDLLRQRLQSEGDSYALYEFQSYTHNLVSMARRCGRVERLREVAALIHEAYQSLEPSPFPWSSRRWVCRGGATCTNGNRLLNAEVMLHSVQFLGVATSVANALTTLNDAPTRGDRAFVNDTVRIAAEHLLRWGDDSSVAALEKKLRASPSDVKNGSSTLFFTDKPLWQIGIFAELSAILRAIGENGLSGVGISENDLWRLKRHYEVLMRFFLARVTLRTAADGRTPGGELADIDGGFWRLYAGRQYAGYAGEEKPVVCVAGQDGTLRPRTVVAAKNVPQLLDTGWDISHARRLVHVLDALQRNRVAIAETWGVTLDERVFKLNKAFANNLLHTVWNGDAAYPLFANYWSGANGWYRVAWDDGTGRCREGTPPFGLTSSFATGGYVTWASYQPLIGSLGLRLYSIFQSNSAQDVGFTERYYRQFARGSTGKNADRAWLMFLPSLVGIRQ